jgi:hypothetical protein
VTPPPSANLPGRDPAPVIAQAVAAAPIARSPTAARAERRAWLVLWVAFATLCVLLASAAKFALDYVSTAEIDLTAGVEVPRGTIFVQNPGSPKYQLASSELGVGSVVEPSRSSNPPASVRLRLFDDSRVTALSGSRIDLVEMNVGRFINQHTLLLRQTAGPVQYQAVGEVQVQVPGGLVKLRDTDTTVWVEGDRTKVLVYRGQARVEAGGPEVVVDTDQRADLGVDHRVGTGPRAEQLLPNGDFANKTENWQTHDLQSGPRDVDGVREFTDAWLDGRLLPALHIVRESRTQAHGETGLQQKLDVPVAGYRHLWLQAWVRVDRQSLSGGGQLGTEYPMMFALEYEGIQDGSAPNWNHGFYITNLDNGPTSFGEPIPAGEWFNYSVDLMAQDDSHRPYRITSLKAMSQGHSYDARVADIRLIGD